jgi:hypothetical protein
MDARPRAESGVRWVDARVAREKSRLMDSSIEALVEDYARRYSRHDADGVSALCEAPFLAVREGNAIHLPDSASIRDHFAAMMDAYRGKGVAVWMPVEIEPHPLGDHAVFATVRWNAQDQSGNVLRDTRTTYHLLSGPEGWRFLSYTNHF